MRLSADSPMPVRSRIDDAAENTRFDFYLNIKREP